MAQAYINFDDNRQMKQRIKNFLEYILVEEQEQTEQTLKMRFKRMAYSYLISLVLTTIMCIPTIYVMKECGHHRATIWWDRFVELYSM
ncbi:MAG: hypothetical protein HUK14_11710 [Muribaculaceae bacterium]|nr:hypothetical protein [Muribaculaceae bacterium]